MLTLNEINCMFRENFDWMQNAKSGMEIKIQIMIMVGIQIIVTFLYHFFDG